MPKFLNTCAKLYEPHCTHMLSVDFHLDHLPVNTSSLCRLHSAHLEPQNKYIASSSSGGHFVVLVSSFVNPAHHLYNMLRVLPVFSQTPTFWFFAIILGDDWRWTRISDWAFKRICTSPMAPLVISRAKRHYSRWWAGARPTPQPGNRACQVSYAFGPRYECRWFDFVKNKFSNRMKYIRLGMSTTDMHVWSLIQTREIYLYIRSNVILLHGSLWNIVVFCVWCDDTIDIGDAKVKTDM